MCKNNEFAENENSHTDFRAMKKQLKLKNRDIANVLGLSESTVRSSTSKSREVPSWAKGMIFIWKLLAINK